MTDTQGNQRALAAKQRALRAARAVTMSVFAGLGAGMCGGLSGCSATVSGLQETDADVARAEDAAVADAAAIALADRPAVTPDAAVTDDAALTGDAAVAAATDVAADSWERCIATDPDYVECCERIGWDWRRGCAAWGPFMPPSMEG